MNRSKYFNLNKNRSINLKIGFILALSFTILAFNWTVEDATQVDYQIDETIDTESIEVVRTTQLEKPTPPPDVVKPTELFKEVETIEFTNEPIEPKVSSNLSEVDFDDINLPLPKKKELPPSPPPPPVPDEDDFFTIVEEMPRFGDCADKLTKNERKMCSDQAFLSYVSQHVKYPAMARENNVQGTVVIEFIVNKKGKITDATILRDIGAGCGQEALRVIKQMPNWTAGQQRGRSVNVKMKLPVRFRLN